MSEIKIGKYKHYKGNLYEVTGIAFSSETLEEMVVYKMLYKTEKFPEGTLWVRPKNMFLEKVEVQGKMVDRFEFIEA